MRSSKSRGERLLQPRGDGCRAACGPWSRPPPGRRSRWRAGRRAAGRSGSRPGRHRSSSARCRDRPSGASRPDRRPPAVALSEALCGRVRSTSSSGRSDFGKNCCWHEAHADQRQRRTGQRWRASTILLWSQRQVEHAGGTSCEKPTGAVLAVALELLGQDERRRSAA